MSGACDAVAVIGPLLTPRPPRVRGGDGAGASGSSRWMTTWAATNSMITPWTMLMMSTGMSVARCMEPAPARMTPNSSAAAD